MKIRHIYTVIREFLIEESELSDKKESFNHVKDEAGEFLYGGSCGEEIIKVRMEKKSGKNWKKV